MGRPAAAIDPIHLRRLASQLSDEEIGRQLGLARVTVTAARKRFGIPSFTEATGLKRRDGGVTHGGRKREITFNEGAFADLRDEGSAYFLGLLMADGSLAKRGNTVEITLAEPDHHLLSDLIHYLGGSGCQPSIRRRADRVKAFHRLTLCSKAMACDLNSWGMQPGGKTTMRLIRPIPPDHLRHFVRGFWDGDGHIGRRNFDLGIQSRELAEQLRSMIGLMGGERPALRETRTKLDKPFYILDVKAKRFESFRQELYRDARFFMERKHCSFRENWC